MTGDVPTTLTGLLLFVVLLLPGFAYVIGKERHGTGQQLSPFRETAAVAAASVSFELIVLAIFAIVRTLLPSVTPDVGELVRNGAAYLRVHYGQVALWATGLLGLSVALAYSASLPKFRKGASRIHLWRFYPLKWMGLYPHASTVSAWWTVFEDWGAERDIRVGCTLDDGSYVDGRFGSFSTEADDGPDRDLVLAEPIHYGPTGADSAFPYACSAMCVSARHIVQMFVTYIGPVTSSSAAEAPAAPDPASSAAQESSASGPS
jgi:Family of unknown function (DUF6338)